MTYRYSFTLAAAATLLGLSACSGSDTPPFTGLVRAANGITDSSGLDVSVSDVATFSNIGVDAASGVTEAPEGSYTAQLTSDNVNVTVNGVSIGYNKMTTVFAYGAVGRGTQGGFFAEESLSAPTDGQAVMQPVHAALQVSSSGSPLNFYFINPGDYCLGNLGCGGGRQRHRGVRGIARLVHPGSRHLRDLRH